MRPRMLGGALFAAVLAIGAPGAPAESGSKERVIELEILLERNDVSILSLQEATLWTEQSLPRKPELTRDTWRKIEHDQSELLIAVHDEKGKVLRTYAYPGRYVSFLETTLASEKSRTPSLEGGFASPSSNVRMLVLPLPEKTMFLTFYRSEIRHETFRLDLETINQERFDVSTFIRPREHDRIEPHEEAASFGWNFLGQCPVPRPPRDRPPRPFEFFEIPRILKLKPPPPELPQKVVKKLKPEFPDPWPTILELPCYPGPGTVTGHAQLHVATPAPGRRTYNVVIYGDGFTSSDTDEGRYQLLAGLVHDAFRDTPPFSNQFQNINLWRIDTECPTSGIANCPGVPEGSCPDPLAATQTYYAISGCMPSTRGVPGCIPSYAGYVGPRSLCPLGVAAQQELPGIYVDLRLVIANCDIYGGAAYPADRLVVVPTCQGFPAEVFKEVVLHETAHTVGHVCDEYWVCVKWEGESFPNFATLEQVEAGEVPWRDLDPAWDMNKHFMNVPPCTPLGLDHNTNMCTGAGATISPSLHGAFWGCQFIDPDSVVESLCCDWDCSDRHSTVAWPYFRPSPQCKMKEFGQPFCFACSDAVSYWLGNPLILFMP